MRAVKNAVATLYRRAQKADDAGHHEVADALDAHASSLAAGRPHPYAERAMRHPAFHGWHGGSAVVDSNGHPAVVYHGTSRADRFKRGRFMKSRATSGPMQYFTDSPEIASDYSANKQDTSAHYDPNEDNDYDLWFRMRPKDRRMAPIPLERAWWHLTPEQRARAAELLPQIGYEDETGPIGVTGQSIGDRELWDYEVKKHRGNWLAAAREIWLNSAAMFGSEEEFMDVLKHAGLTDFVMQGKDKERPAVIPVFLAIKNPLDTSNIPDKVISALEKASRRARRRPGVGADFWDKRTRDPQHWMDMLRQDLEDGSTLTWTSIPDWVTRVLESFGYDGVKDTGGKNGGHPHTVWVPFHEHQVKSALGNKGTYSPDQKRIDR